MIRKRMRPVIDTGHIDSAKYVHSSKGEVLDLGNLQAGFPHLTFNGKIQESGLLGYNPGTGDYEVFVRHPWWVPVTLPGATISYGMNGKQTDEHVIHLLGRTYGAKAAPIAKEVLEALRTGKTLPYEALMVGKEQEAFAHNQHTGTVVELAHNEQFEFQAGVHEDALPPFRQLHEAIAARIEQLAAREKTHPGILLMDTSAPLSGTPDDPGMQLNNGDGGNYIRPWAEYLKKHLIFSDKNALRILNGIARTHGYTNYTDLMGSKGFQVLWPVASCQTSIGMPHLQDPEGRQSFPLELAVATADIFNSHAGAILDMLMASSPFLFGVKPASQLRDHRIALRYIFSGASPSPGIGSVKQLKERWDRAGRDGMLYTLDRVAFQGKRANQAVHPVIYGSARLRVEAKDPTQTLGRVENTIAGSSPSLLDEIAHDGLIFLLSIASFEAVAGGKTIREYFGTDYPHLVKWRQRRKITEAFNIHGARHDNVHAVLHECLRLLGRMQRSYPPLRDLITFVSWRIANLQAPPDPDLAVYRRSARGPISEVMIAMHDAGKSPLEIMKELHDYQHWLSNDLLPAAKTPELFKHLNSAYAVDEITW